jgi:quercetin dioxygenase-like cupin family protein
MTNTLLPPTIRSAEDGEQRWFFGGGIHTWKVTSQESGGAFMLFEDAMDEGKATPLHIHPSSDETMYVLKGEILVHIDGREWRVGPHGLAVAPRGVPHAFMVLSKRVRMLCLHTPGSCDDFYLDASEPLDDIPEMERTIDLSVVQSSAQRNPGIELLGPPPFERP